MEEIFINGKVVSCERNTLETKIQMTVDFSDSIEKGGMTGTSGIGFFDHMMNSLAVHAKIKISLTVEGDLSVDCHHTIEDVGIVFGKILKGYVGTLSGYRRYGTSYIPMDEALARSVIDISGRPYLVFDYRPKAPMIGEYDTQMTREFFRAVAFNMGATLHIAVLYGENDHHCVEAIFKAFAHSLSDAWQKTADILSAKGIL